MKWIVFFTVFFVARAYAEPKPQDLLTPGAVANVTTKQVCIKGYTRDVRHVTAAMKREVFRRYGIPYTPANRKLYEVDHRVSLELGGSNVIENLWPQPWEPKIDGARAKDVVETNLHRRVCVRGDLSLKEAQDIILHRWRAYYSELKQ